MLRSNGSGSTSDVIGGIEWAINDHLKEKKDAEKSGKVYKGAVANVCIAFIYLFYIRKKMDTYM